MADGYVKDCGVFTGNSRDGAAMFHSMMKDKDPDVAMQGRALKLLWGALEHWFTLEQNRGGVTNAMILHTAPAIAVNVCSFILQEGLRAAPDPAALLPKTLEMAGDAIAEGMYAAAARL